MKYVERLIYVLQYIVSPSVIWVESFEEKSRGAYLTKPSSYVSPNIHFIIIN